MSIKRSEKSKEKLQVREEVYVYLGNDTLGSLRAEINEWIQLYGEDAKLSCGYDGDDFIEYYRLETDKEYEKRQERLRKSRERSRLAKEKKEQAKKETLSKEESDARALYEELKRRFG